MNVICLQDEAFYNLVEEVYNRLKDKTNTQKEKWIAADAAMVLLNITSRTTLQKLRDEGKIRYSQPQKKIILYDRESIETYLELNAKNTF